MDSLVDHFARLHRGHLRLAKVDVDQASGVAATLGVESAPTLILVEAGLQIARLEGRASLPEIAQAIEPLLGIDVFETPLQLAV